MSPSIRFLFLVVAGWIALRGVALMVVPAPAPARERPAPAIAAAAAPRFVAPEVAATPEPPAALATTFAYSIAAAPVRALAPRSPDKMSHRQPIDRVAQSLVPGPPVAAPPPFIQPPLAPYPPASSDAPTASRLSASAWALVRPSLGSASLASGGTLGASQAGARLRYALAPWLAASLRASAPLGHRLSGEAAAGVTVTPSPRVPLHLTLERRMALGDGGGRSAFALFAEGGVYGRALPQGFRLDGYAQAGVVGARRRDLFADGAVAITRPLAGTLSVGGGVWAGAQPGVSRVDVGPRLSLRLTPRARVDLDWRQRVAGNARPASGPALTIASDF